MIGAHIEVILIVTGVLTAALLQFIAPIPIMRMIYGEAPSKGVGLLLARHWGLLIFLIGAPDLRRVSSRRSRPGYAFGGD
jgi:hypothetical protein